MSNKKVTISDVAKLAGVGKTSVSRYLNGEFNILSEGMKESIALAIEELHYQPSQIARSMKRGKTKLIALVLADIRNPYSLDLLQGVEKASRENGYRLLLFNTDNQIKEEKKILDSLLGYQVEGVISQALRTHDQNFQEFPLPIVSVDRMVNGLDCDVISLDNKQATKLMVDHLLDLDIRSFLFISEKIFDIQPREERLHEIKNIISKFDECHINVLELDDFNDIDVLDRTIKCFYGDNCFKKAIISVNGLTTLNIALALHRLNLQCGKDIALIGFDDFTWLSLTLGGISALRQPTFEMGYHAFNLLLDRINEDRINRSKSKFIYYPGKLVIRNSTKNIV